MGKIMVLDDQTIDKIAAGEVIERPASIVKELVENAIDAGASAVTVEIKDGGISLIRITDNGGGMEPEDIPVAFLRHATSKIRTALDLLDVSSLGFRGEALSSIAAVCQVELISKTPESLIGTRYLIEGGKEKGTEEIGAPSGTTFLVRNIFYNTPARKKFLKSAQTEAGYIGDLMERMALSHPEVSFKFLAGGQTKLHTSGNHNLKDIIYHIYGRDIARNLIEIRRTFEDGTVLEGFIGKPVISRGNRNYENYFVNGRYIRSNILSKAIEDGYQAFMMKHKYPFTALHLTIPAEELDINVHPAKMELRFSDNEQLYHSVYQAIADALANRELIPKVSVGKEEQPQKPKPEQTPTPEPFETNRRAKERELTLSDYGKQDPVYAAFCDSMKGSRDSEPAMQKAATAGTSGTNQVQPDGMVKTDRLQEAGTDQICQAETVWRMAAGARTGEGHLYMPGNDTAAEVPSEYQPEAGVVSKPSEHHSEAGAVSMSAGHQPEAGVVSKPSEHHSEAGAVSMSAGHQPEAGAVSKLAGHQPEAGAVSKPSEYQPEAGAGGMSVDQQPEADAAAQKHQAMLYRMDQLSTQKVEERTLFNGKLLDPKNAKQHRIIGQVFDTYWLVEFQDQLFIIDQHAAHEKVLYERTMKAMANRQYTSQMLNPPLILTLSMREAELLEKHRKEFEEIGFEIEAFGGKEYALRAVPDNLFGITREDLFLEMLDSLDTQVDSARAESIKDKVATMSCKAAVKGNHRLSVAEVHALIDELMTLENPYHCPHGRPTIISMTKYEMEKKFKRIV